MPFGTPRIANPPNQYVRENRITGMATHEAEDTIAEARLIVSRWLEKETGCRYSSDAQTADAVRDRLNHQFQLTLQTNWNPSSCVFDARWEHNQRAADGLERPFSAEVLDDARVLACAAAVRLIESLDSQSSDQTNGT